MRALTRRRYGGVAELRLEDLPAPEPGAGEVAVDVAAASLNKADLYALRGEPFFIRFQLGLLRPRRPMVGADFAGRIASTGPGVEGWNPGDAVFGDLSGHGWGALAERIVVPVGAIALAPNRLPLEEAAALPMAATTALQALRDEARVGKGDRVLVVGASGGVGTFALQIARALGADVEAVTSAEKAEAARKAGAAVVHDRRKDYHLPTSPTYDAILGVNGFHDIRDYERALRTGGRYICIGGEGRQFLQAMTRGRSLSRRTGKTLKTVSCTATRERLDAVRSLVDRGEVTPLVEATYPLDRAKEAYERFAEGHAGGKVVVTVQAGGGVA